MKQSYSINAYDISLTCTLSEFPTHDGIYYSFVFNSNTIFRVTSSINPRTSTICYIDNIEYNKSCIKDHALEENGELVKYMKSVLWTIVHLFPNIKTIELKDYLYICCENNSRQHMVNLACEYIAKYNNTWFEKHFNAIIYSKDSYNSYRESLNVLDNPLDIIEYILDIRPELEKYKNIYKISLTPREFINNLRNAYPETYYFETASWMPSYLRLLRIIYYCDMWSIYKSNIIKPYNYNIETLDILLEKDKSALIQKANYRLVTSYDEHGSCVGYYDTFE